MKHEMRAQRVASDLSSLKIVHFSIFIIDTRGTSTLYIFETYSSVKTRLNQDQQWSEPGSRIFHAVCKSFQLS